MTPVGTCPEHVKAAIPTLAARGGKETISDCGPSTMLGPP
jgi:hypothetical protein